MALAARSNGRASSAPDGNTAAWRPRMRHGQGFAP